MFYGRIIFVVAGQVGQRQSVEHPVNIAAKIIGIAIILNKSFIITSSINYLF
jgi:hypothetical protein